MTEFIDGSENISVHGVFNWILLLTIFSVITVVGNYVGYKHPIADSLVGMAILSLITLAGVWMERKLPFNISSIISMYSDDFFWLCYSLVGGAGTTYNENNYSSEYARIDGGPSATGYFTRKTA